MSDEVKQAAERLRDGKYSRGDLDEYYMPSQKFEDMETLSGAFLVEHANDAEAALPLTAEILQASGWANISTRPTVIPRVRFRCTERPLDVVQYVNVDGWSVESASEQDEIGHIETVGDLRSLLEALHVPAVVNVPKGGE